MSLSKPTKYGPRDTRVRFRVGGNEFKGTVPRSAVDKAKSGDWDARCYLANCARFAIDNPNKKAFIDAESLHVEVAPDE